MMQNQNNQLENNYQFFDQTIYPEPVIQVSKEICSTIIDDLIAKIDGHLDKKLLEDCLMSCSNSYIFQKWLIGEELKFSNEKDVTNTVNLTITTYRLEKLVKLGLVDRQWLSEKNDWGYTLTSKGYAEANKI